MQTTNYRALPSSATLSATPRASLLARHQLTSFFALAFAGSWLFEIPLALSRAGLGLLPFNPSLDLMDLLVVLGSFAGPALAAFVVTGAVEGRAGAGRLFRRFIQWRAGLQWYLLALFGTPLIMALGASVFLGAAPLNGLIQHWPLVFTLYLPYTLTIGFLLGGGPAEEPGWRGFALPRLQQRRGALVGSIILGALWGLWHLPLFLIPALDGIPDLRANILSFVGFMVAIVAFSVIVTWIYNNTAGSLLIVMALHSARNATVLLERQMFPAFLHFQQRYWALALAFTVCALAIILFTRGRLSYTPELAAELAGASQAS